MPKDHKKKPKSAAQSTDASPKAAGPSPKAARLAGKPTDPSSNAAAVKGPGVTAAATGDAPAPRRPKMGLSVYLEDLRALDIELVKLQAWIVKKGLKVLVIFEGRDAAGKGGAIKRITEVLNPRIVRVEALPKPTEREASEWYFQRYVDVLPAAGEMVIFDRSWYNRAGVERVMGFCTEEQVREFFRDCPEFERMLLRSGIVLIKYWFSVSDEEQDKRFKDRIDDPVKAWKFSPMDLEGRDRWEQYSRAKDEMLQFTDTEDSPWWVVNGDDKKRARLNVISHLLSRIEYEDVLPKPFKLPPRKAASAGYVRPPMDSQRFVPEVY
jgi:polyphosphate kinase 2